MRISEIVANKKHRFACQIALQHKRDAGVILKKGLVRILSQNQRLDTLQRATQLIQLRMPVILKRHIHIADNRIQGASRLLKRLF